MDNYFFEEEEISNKRYKAKRNDILIIFKNLAENWYFDGIDVITQIIEEKDKYVLFGQISNNSYENIKEDDNVKFLEINPFSEFSERTQYTEKDSNKIIYPQINGLPINAPSESICFGYISIKDVFRQNKIEIDVILVCSWPVVLSFWKELDKILHNAFKVIGIFSLTKKPSKSTKVPSDKTQARAYQLRKIKENHPNWGYEQVAVKYNEEEKQDITGETVRNAYRAMGWNWKKSTKIY